MARKRSKTATLVAEEPAAMETMKYEIKAKAETEVQQEADRQAQVDNFVNEIRHQVATRTGEALDGTDYMTWDHDHQPRIREFDNDLADLPTISVEVWRFEDPSGFVYNDLYPTADWGGSELPLGSGKWHNPGDWAWFDRRVSPVLDIPRSMERRDQMAARGFVWVPWQELPEILRQYITLCLLPPGWDKRFLADQNDSYVLDRVMVYVKGELP